MSLYKKYIVPFISDPQKLFWLYITVNMLPSIFLLFSEPFNVWGKIVLILFPLGLYLFVLSIFKKTGLIQLILFPLLFLHAFQLVLLYLFGEDVIAVDMFLNVVTTNPSEAGEVLNSLWPSVVFVCIVYIPTTIIAIRQIRKKIYLQAGFQRKAILSGVALLFISYVFTFFSKNVNTERFTYYEDVYPTNVLYNLDFAVKKWKKSRNYSETSKDFVFNAVRDSSARQREVYVMVIGETGRAESWSLYGYDRKTNPKLEQKNNLYHFSDAITQSNVTHKSVSIMLSTASAEDYDIIYQQKSIIEAFREVGFTTVFLSNQGANHTFTEYFAQEADCYDNIRSGKDGIMTVNKYDDALLPLFEHYLDSVQNNLFVVIHTYGSHFKYNERYPDEFSVFKPDDVTEIRRQDRDKLVNAYDNTILYTDGFLSKVIDLLNSEDLCSTVFYSSDHGEDILDDNRMRFLHSSPSPTFYQLKIPMFVWFSDNYIKNFPGKVKNVENNRNKPVATNAIFHTLLDMADVKTEYLDVNLSLVSDHFKISKRMYLNDHDEPIFFYNANLKKEDKEMIEKRHMYH